jgi:hypothetical protein
MQRLLKEFASGVFATEPLQCSKVYYMLKYTEYFRKKAKGMCTIISAVIQKRTCDKKNKKRRQIKWRARSKAKVLFCLVSPDIRKSIGLFEGSQSSPACLPEIGSKLDSFGWGKGSVTKRSSMSYGASSIINYRTRSCQWSLFFPMARQPLGGLGRLIFRGFTITHFLDTPHSVGLL